jgi:hypothetical protein
VITNQLERSIEEGPFSGTGPHTIHTKTLVPTSVRFGARVRFLIEDLGTRLVLYHGTFDITIRGAHVIETGAIVEHYAAVGWAGNVDVEMEIVSAEPVTEIVIPDGYTVRVVYDVQGVAWTAAA